MCICGRDDGKTMLICDNCEKWYHLDCLGYTEEEAEAVYKQGEDELWFHSDDCREKHAIKTGNAKTKEIS